MPPSRFKDFVSFRDEVIGYARCQGHDGQSGIGRSLGRHNAAVTDEQVRDIVRATELVHDRRRRIGTHPRRADEMRVTRLLHDFARAGGPQGAGALVIRDGAPLAAEMLGGGQERSHRAGTENVAGIAGFGAAADVVAKEVNSSTRALRDRFERELKALSPEAIVFGASSPRLSNTSNFALPGIRAETAVIALDLEGVMVSSGAACSSGKVKPSHVLRAMGVSEDLSACALRVSFGWDSTDADVDAALAALGKLLSRARSRVAA